MQQSIEQPYAIKFCFRLGKSGASTLEMIQQAYGREGLSQAQVFRWHKMYKEGRESGEDEPPAAPTLPQQTFSSSPKGKPPSKGATKGTLDDVKRACTHALKDVSLGDFQGAYEAWKRRLQKCVHVQGAYFEVY
ncbi:HTH_48 domain-containing protein [Trichonephila clavipes]|nr:HTH_48 domain-containing protein [Trichonephila clavipes]